MHDKESAIRGHGTRQVLEPADAERAPTNCALTVITISSSYARSRASQVRRHGQSYPFRFLHVSPPRGLQTRLGRTFSVSETQLLAAYFSTGGVSNGPRSGELLIKRIKRVGFGFRNFANYRLRRANLSGLCFARSLLRVGGREDLHVECIQLLPTEVPTCRSAQGQDRSQLRACGCFRS